MAIIPNGQKFETLSSSVDTTERKSTYANDKGQAFTMADIAETVNADAGESYLVYTGYFQQTGYDTPVVTELKNTTGASLTATRFAAGEYEFSLNAPTGVEGIPWLMIQNSNFVGTNYISAETLITSGYSKGFYVVVRTYSDRSYTDLNNDRIYFELRIYN